jgi:hypothetical protein
VLAAYFPKICIQLAASQMQISFGWSPAACKLLINLGIFYWIATSQMQFASGWRPNEWNLHTVGGWLNEICIWLIEICIWLNEICIRLAANWMQILQKYAASTLLSG